VAGDMRNKKQKQKTALKRQGQYFQILKIDFELYGIGLLLDKW